MSEATEAARYRAVPASERYAATRRQIEVAAQEAFLRYGYDDTTVDMIAALAGVSPRTVYRHFRSKGALMVRAVDDWMVAMLAALETGMATLPPGPALLNAIAGMDLDIVPRDFYRDINSDLDARGYWLATVYRHQSDLAALLRKASEDPFDAHREELHWQVLAAQLLSVMDTGFRWWLDDPDQHSAYESIRSALLSAGLVSDTAESGDQGEHHGN